MQYNSTATGLNRGAAPSALRGHTQIVVRLHPSYNKCMQPDLTNLIEKIELEIPVIGLYDAPDATPSEPLVEPGPGKRECIFSYYERWIAGNTLRITGENHGCSGAGQSLFGKETRSREDFVSFLVEGEGLKASEGLMNRWIDYHKNYTPKYGQLLIGPLHANQYEYLLSVTFYVNADQLSALILGGHYNSAPGGLTPVLAPFGSGCMQLLLLFEDLNIPQAIIGATDIAMRKYIDPEVTAFTVTRPMFEQLCALDERSFLYKPFWKSLKQARNGTR